LSAPVKGEPLASGEVSRVVCPCGTPFLLLRGHRLREYCSDRCRQRAYRQRHNRHSRTQQQSLTR
jgi:hypothetical protein